MGLRLIKRGFFIPVTVGAAAGFFVLHPYSMLVYFLHKERGLIQSGDFFAALLRDALRSMNPGMLYMGLPYALLGAGAGLFFGLWREAERKREEMEKSKTAIATLRQLMVTLSHYLLNTSVVIGGFASHILKAEHDPELRKHLDVIKEESELIEDVVKALQSLESVVAEEYTRDSHTLMIDISRELERRIGESAAMRSEKIKELGRP